MIVSRGKAAFTAARLFAKNATLTKQAQRQSSHHWYYRTASEPPAITVRAAQAVQGLAWWWVLWHLWTEPDHILGEFPYPDPSKWSDEELGIA